MAKGYLTLILIVVLKAAAFGAVIDLETGNSFSLGDEEFIYAGDVGGQFSSGNADFLGYHYTNPWDYWGGFVASNRTEIGADDMFHQFTSVTGTDHTVGAGGTYAIGYNDWESSIGCTISFTEVQDVASASFVNVAWTAEYIEEYYDVGDYYFIKVTAYDSGMNVIGSKNINMTNAVEWSTHGLGFQDVSKLGVTMVTNDDWTPMYFCIDDINSETVPEPSAGFAVIAALSGLAVIRKKRK